VDVPAIERSLVERRRDRLVVNGGEMEHASKSPKAAMIEGGAFRLLGRATPRIKVVDAMLFEPIRPAPAALGDRVGDLLAAKRRLTRRKSASGFLRIDPARGQISRLRSGSTHCLSHLPMDASHPLHLVREISPTDEDALPSRSYPWSLARVRPFDQAPIGF
jgi:hypothetical protein